MYDFEDGLLLCDLADGHGKVPVRKTSNVAWLLELGAVRPMAPLGYDVLVLGTLHSGVYPIEWRLYYDTGPIEQWKLFGIPCAALRREDCVRILERCK